MRWNRGWMKRPQFSLFAIFALTTLCAVGIAIWVRAESQRQAVAALRSLGIDDVYYDFYPSGMHPELGGMFDAPAIAPQPSWLSAYVGIDVCHGATKAIVSAERIDFKLPHLKRLVCLQEIYVFDNGNDDKFQTRDERIQAAIERLQREFPNAHVEEYIPHGLNISTIPVVG